MSQQLEALFGLASRGVKSSVTNLFYELRRPGKRDVNFWCRGMAWPIFDDDDRVLATVSCASASSRPWSDGQCKVEVGFGAG